MASKVVASAPNKVIVTGEHSVVWGGNSIAAPISLRNKAEASFSGSCGKRPCVRFSGKWASGKVYADGTFQGPALLAAKAGLVRHFLESEKVGLDKCVQIKEVWGGAPKGTGNSASIAAAIALCLYKIFGKKPNKRKLFDCVQKMEEVAHGGKPSGVDANAVLSDCAQKFHKKFLRDGTSVPVFEDVRLELPKGSVLLLVNSYKSGKIANTGDLVNAFGRHYGFVNKDGSVKKPGDLSQKERGSVVAPFNKIVSKIQSQLQKSGDPVLLGALLDENHQMLKAAGVSSASIEKVLSVSKKAGALGGKLIGAGGNGGAAIVLCLEKDAKKVCAALKREKYSFVPVEFARVGAKLEN